MKMHGIAKGKSFQKTIEMLRDGENGGSKTYYQLAYWANQWGYPEWVEAILKNAMEDSAHGGKYSVMLGEGVADEAAFKKVCLAMYQAEAGAEAPLTQMAEEVRASGQDGADLIADEILETIPEEIEHAKRLEAAFEKYGWDFEKLTK